MSTSSFATLYSLSHLSSSPLSSICFLSSPSPLEIIEDTDLVPMNIVISPPDKTLESETLLNNSPTLSSAYLSLNYNYKSVASQDQFNSSPVSLSHLFSHFQSTGRTKEFDFLSRSMDEYFPLHEFIDFVSEKMVILHETQQSRNSKLARAGQLFYQDLVFIRGFCTNELGKLSFISSKRISNLQRLLNAAQEMFGHEFYRHMEGAEEHAYHTLRFCNPFSNTPDNLTITSSS